MEGNEGSLCPAVGRYRLTKNGQIRARHTLYMSLRNFFRNRQNSFRIFLQTPSSHFVGKKVEIPQS